MSYFSDGSEICGLSFMRPNGPRISRSVLASNVADGKFEFGNHRASGPDKMTLSSASSRHYAMIERMPALQGFDDVAFEREFRIAPQVTSLTIHGPERGHGS